MTATPQTMGAIRLHAPGVKGLRHEAVDTPLLHFGEVLVAVQAAAITCGELECPLDRLPAVPSYELSGVVAAVADDVDVVSAGDEVYALTPFDRDGVAAEFAVVPAATLVSKPSTLDDAVSRVDLVFDTVGGELPERAPALLANGGRLVSVAEEPPGRRDVLRGGAEPGAADRSALGGRWRTSRCDRLDVRALRGGGRLRAEPGVGQAREGSSSGLPARARSVQQEAAGDAAGAVELDVRLRLHGMKGALRCREQSTS
jgi:NADPH:quinone reductase-like Zn-dependent oxidoreductase